MGKGRDERTDFLYAPSRKEYPDHHPSLKQKLRLYKILVRISHYSPTSRLSEISIFKRQQKTIFC